MVRTSLTLERIYQSEKTGVQFLYGVNFLLIEELEMILYLEFLEKPIKNNNYFWNIYSNKKYNKIY